MHYIRLEVVLQVKLMCSFVTKPLETDLVKFGLISMLFGLFSQVFGVKELILGGQKLNFGHEKNCPKTFGIEKILMFSKKIEQTLNKGLSEIFFNVLKEKKICEHAPKRFEKIKKKNIRFGGKFHGGQNDVSRPVLNR